jgi:hypothetical protein
MPPTPRSIDPAHRRKAAAALIAGVLPATLLLRRKGYKLGNDTIVRCRAGHLFTTIWVPLASVKAIRLGWWRFQRCPVGNHWTLVHPVNESELTQDEIATAHAARDVRIP